jgi:hypothetical protein
VVDLNLFIFKMEELLLELAPVLQQIILFFELVMVKCYDLQNMAFFIILKTPNEELLQSLPFQLFLHRHCQASIRIGM